MSVKSYSPAEQERLLRRFARQGSYRAMALFGREMFQLEQLMLERTMGVGLAEYGDGMFHKSLEQLRQESREEASDQIAYQAIYCAKELMVIP